MDTNSLHVKPGDEVTNWDEASWDEGWGVDAVSTNTQCCACWGHGHLASDGPMDKKRIGKGKKREKGKGKGDYLEKGGKGDDKGKGKGQGFPKGEKGKGKGKGKGGRWEPYSYGKGYRGIAMLLGSLVTRHLRECVR